MKMGNVAKEPRLSDLLFSIDMERREEDIAAMLDCLPDDLENSFSDIDVNFFLGNKEFTGSIDSLGDDIISLSSYDSDEFEKLLSGEPVKNKTLKVKDKKNNKKHKNNIIPKKVVSIKKEVPEPKEIFNISNEAKFNYSEREEISVTEISDVESSSEDKEDYNYTFYVAPVKKKKRKKRKDPEYCKKKRSKSEKNLKIVIKRKERQTEFSKPSLNSVSDFHLSPGNSPPLTNEPSTPSSHELLDFSFCDIPFNDSFSLSIAEKVKTKRRCRMNSSEINGSPSDRKEKRIAKKHKKIMRANNKSIPSIKSISFATPNQTKSEIKIETDESNSINLRTLKNASDEASNSVPSLHRFISNNGKLRFKDRCNSLSKSTVVNNRVVSSKTKNFHDYSKQLPLGKNCDESKQELFRNLPALLPINNSKAITNKKGCNQTALRFSLRRSSSESDKGTSNAQESFDIPVSMAEVEVASFEDAVEIPAEPKITYNIRLNSHHDSFPSLMQTKFPIVLLTPLNNKNINSENSSLTPPPPSDLFSQINKSRRSSVKSNSGLDSIHPSQHLRRIEKKHGHPPSPAESKLCSELHSKNHSSVSLRPSTRSHTKSPEPKKSQNNSKFKREIDQKLHTSVEKEDLEARRLNFDNRKAIEERRVLYVGKIPANSTHVNLHHQFSRFGEIENIQIKTKEMESQTGCGSVFDHEYGDWNLSSSQKLKITYGFITFKRSADVAKAIEDGKKLWPRLTLNYGGRREFVKVNYSDLDGNFAEKMEFESDYGYSSKKDDDFDFARELKAAQQRRGLAQCRNQSNSQHSYDLKGA